MASGRAWVDDHALLGRRWGHGQRFSQRAGRRKADLCSACRLALRGRAGGAAKSKKTLLRVGEREISLGIAMAHLFNIYSRQLPSQSRLWWWPGSSKCVVLKCHAL